MERPILGRYIEVYAKVVGEATRSDVEIRDAAYVVTDSSRLREGCVKYDEQSERGLLRKWNSRSVSIAVARVSPGF